MKAKTNKTNVEFMTELMEYSNCGALMHCFVITAIEKYAKACVDNAETLRHSMVDGLIDGDAWVRCAREAHYKVNRHIHGYVDQKEIEAEHEIRAIEGGVE